MPAWISSAISERQAGIRVSSQPVPIGTIKAAVFVLALGPLARLLLVGTTGAWGGLGANPIEFVTRSTGTWTLVFVCITLAITPARRLSGWNWLQRVRRMLGLFAFFYGALHFTTYFWLDQWFDLAAIARDIVKRPFITMGFTAFVLMIPLAVTSTDAMVRRLGRRWGKLHRLVYAVAIAAILHYWWHKAGKNDFSEVGWYAAVVILLLGWRLVDRWRKPAAPRASA